MARPLTVCDFLVLLPPLWHSSHRFISWLYTLFRMFASHLRMGTAESFERTFVSTTLRHIKKHGQLRCRRDSRLEVEQFPPSMNTVSDTYSTDSFPLDLWRLKMPERVVNVVDPGYDIYNAYAALRVAAAFSAAAQAWATMSLIWRLVMDGNRVRTSRR